MKRKPIIHFKFSITTRLEEGKGATRLLMFAVGNIFNVIDILKKKKKTTTLQLYNLYLFNILMWLFDTNSVRFVLFFNIPIHIS